jgi:hypothetical protein
MKILFVILILQLLPVSCLTKYCQARAFDVIDKDGYHIAIEWQTSKNKLYLKGIIKDGQLCNRLNISLYLENNNGSTVHINRQIIYQITTGTSFSGNDEFYSSQRISSDKDWFVSSLYLDCK